MPQDAGAERAAPRTNGRPAPRLPRRLRPQKSAMAALSLALLLFLPPAFAAASSAAALCDAAAEAAAARHGVPAAILRALTRTETGRAREGALEPWPWTVNMEGEGRWFDDPRGALAFVESRRAAGARSFDIGCFQVNHLWHGENFPSVEAMFDPRANADYAARFLAELHAETGDWTRAAGYYHSRTPEFYERYRGRFLAILARDAERPRLNAPEAVEVKLASAADIPQITWKSVEPVIVARAGGVDVRLNRGLGSPLRPARGPLFIAAPSRAPSPADADRAYP